MAKKANERKPIYMEWWFWSIVAAVVIASIIILVLSIPRKKEKEYMSPEELSAKIEKDKQNAIKGERESIIEIVKATKKGLEAYKELYGFYPSKLSDMGDAWKDDGTVTYSYDGVSSPVIYYYLDGKKIEETIE